MKTHRYTQIIVPIDRYVSRLTPQARKLLGVLEGGLVLLLISTVVLYVG